MGLSNAEYTRTYGAPGQDGSFGRFYRDAILNHAASQAAGREIWEDVEMVEIILPANPWSRPCERVTDEHRARWPKAYEQFQREEEQRPDGKPLEEWPEVSRAMCRELKALQIFTVEQVAQLGDAMMQRLGPGARVLVQKAVAYCEEMQRMGPLNRLVNEKEILANTVAAQANQIAELGALCERLQAQLNGIMDRPHPLAATAPSALDPVEQHRQAQFNAGGAGALAASSLDKLSGRPRAAAPAPAEAAPAARPPSSLDKLVAGEAAPKRSHKKKAPAAA